MDQLFRLRKEENWSETREEGKNRYWDFVKHWVSCLVLLSLVHLLSL